MDITSGPTATTAHSKTFSRQHLGEKRVEQAAADVGGGGEGVRLKSKILVHIQVLFQMVLPIPTNAPAKASRILGAGPMKLASRECLL
jgi:hypothetical protein